MLIIGISLNLWYPIDNFEIVVDQLDVIANKLETCLNEVKITPVPVQVDNVKTQLQPACENYFGDSNITIARYSQSIEQAYSYIEQHPNTKEAKNLLNHLNVMMDKLNEQKSSLNQNKDTSEYKQLLNDLAEKTKQLDLYC